MQRRTVTEHGQILTFSEGFRDAQGNFEFADVVGKGFFFAVTVEALHHKGRFLGLEEGVVHACRLGHVPWHTHMHAPKRVNNGRHGRSAVPNAFKPVAPRANNQRGFLASRRAVSHGGQIVPHDLQRVVQVVEVLDFSNGAQSTQRHANALSDDAGFANARVAHTDFTKFFLHAFHDLVDAANPSRVFAKRQHARIATEHGLKVALEDLAAIELLGVRIVSRRHRHHAQGTVGAVAVQRAAVADVVVAVKRLQPTSKRVALGRRLSGRVGQGATDGLRHFGTAGIAVVPERLCTGSVQRGQQIGRRQALLIDGGPVGRPGLFLLGANVFFGLFAQGIQFFLGGRTFLQEELPHLSNAIVFRRPGQTLFRLVPLVGSRRAVALWLGDFLHVNQDWNVVFPAPLGRLLVRGNQVGVIPSFDAVNDQTVGRFFSLETGQSGRDALLHRLVLLGNRNAVPVVPHAHEHGHLEHARRVHGFPKQPFRRARVANRADRDFVATIGESGHAFCEFRHRLEHLARLGQSDQPWHLASRRADVGRAVEVGHQILPGSVFVQGPGGKVTSHLSARRRGVRFDIGMGVERCEVLLHAEQSPRHHERLVPVVPRPPIALSHHLGQSHLSHLLAVPKNPKLRLPRQHLFASEQRGFTADAHQFVIRKQRLAKRLDVLGCR